jgi:hypothetical protein
MTSIEYKQRLDVFKAQTKNVRSLELAWGDINRQINASILTKNEKALITFTRLFAVVYCAIAEAYFSKIIHTPYGLELDELRQIKASGASNVKAGWLKCVELAVRKIKGKSNHAPNVRKKLDRLIHDYIFDPSLIRNKLAHGQWTIALNRENTSTNGEITKSINELDVVEIYRRKKALEIISNIIEDIIESPTRAHPRDYWAHITSLENDLNKMKSWNLEKKRSALLKKKSFMRQGTTN